MTEYYNKFSTFLKARYGEKVWKVSVDAGFKCPNRNCDSKREGCIFCRIDSFSKQSPETSVEQQITKGIKTGQERYNINKFIVYFQASTNTFAPIDVLQRLFELAISFKGVVGLSISTRPDCLPPAVINLIQSLAQKVDVWVELGLQSSFESTLKLLNRGHTYKDYLKAIELLQKCSVRICTHLMIGLPGESRKEILGTAEEIARSGIQEVKLHPLLVLKDTPLAEMYLNGECPTLELSEYASLTCDFLERLPSHMVIQRLTAEAPEDILLAPSLDIKKGSGV